MITKTISLLLSLIFITTANAYNLSGLNTLRVPVGEHNRIDNALERENTNIDEIKKRIVDFVNTCIGNRHLSPFSTDYLTFNIDNFMPFIEKKNADVFEKIYQNNWGLFANELVNIPESPAYILLMEYLEPYSKTYLYRYQEQHIYIKEKLPQLLAEKIEKRNGKDPIYIKLVTFGGGLDPISIGATLKETIEKELENNYPGIVFEKDIFLEISNIEISPNVIKKTVSRLNKGRFTLKDTKYTPYNQIAPHLDFINKNKSWFSKNIKFILGSIASNTLIKTVLADKPDFIMCSNCFYQLDVPHQIDFINFLGQNLPENTDFIFSCDTTTINIAVRQYFSLTYDDKPIAALICSDEQGYPPLFEKYFNIEKLPIIEKQTGNSVVMKRKPYIEALASTIKRSDFISKEYESSKINNLQLYERLKNILYRNTFDEDTIAQDIDTIKLLCFYYKYYQDYFEKQSYGYSESYFDTHPDLDPEKVKLTRDILVRITRDLFDPTFERKGFIAIDLFCGILFSKANLIPPYILSEDELRKIGYDNETLYRYGIDIAIPWANVQTNHTIGHARQNVFNLTIQPSSVDVVTSMNGDVYGVKEIQDMLLSVKRILKPGGWIYIAPYLHTIPITIEDYKNTLEALGFTKIDIIKFHESGLSYHSTYPMPEFLIKAQKPINQLNITNPAKNLSTEL